MSAPNDTITLSIKDQSGDETFFKVKKTTPMKKIMAAYAQRKGVPQDTLRFILDGERVVPEDTPKTLEMLDKDQIDCMLEMKGGSALR